MTAAFPLWNAGAILKTTLLNEREPITIVKAADQSYTSDTTLNNDSELFFTLEANRVYQVRLMGFITGAQAGDIKCAWSMPAGVSGLRACYGPELGTTDRSSQTSRWSGHGFTTEVGYGTAETGGFGVMFEDLIITVGGTSGTAQFRHAQNASNATATTMRAQSWLKYLLIG